MLELKLKHRTLTPPKEVESQLFDLLGLRTFPQPIKKMVLRMEAGKPPTLDIECYVFHTVPEPVGLDLNRMVEQALIRVQARIDASAAVHLSQMHFKNREYDYSSLRKTQ